MFNQKNEAKEKARQAFIKALNGSDTDAAALALEQFGEAVAAEQKAAMEQFIAEQNDIKDEEILAKRGLRRLTSEEKQYYTDVIGAMKSENPQQAIANLSYTLPETVVSAVFEEIRTRHPLLDRIDFVPTKAKVKLLMNTNGQQEATWGELCSAISTELSSGFDLVDVSLNKITAWMPVCKAALELGAEWLDNYVREVLREAFANGLEKAIVDGTGKNMPIGMTRQVGPDVTVVGGVYPKKTAIAVERLDPQTYGRLLSYIAVNNGAQRTVDNLIMIVNPVDYYTKVMPATSFRRPDGTYVNDLLPYQTEVFSSPYVEQGEAILGMASRYFIAAGIGKDGRIEYSDEAKFLDDVRVYAIKGFANGRAKDDNAFLLLDISGLVPSVPKVETVTTELSEDATLAALSIFGAALTPDFAADTTTYTATTTDASNIVYALPANAGATLEVKLGSTVVDNGTAVTWATGSNTLTVKVTAEDGETTETYTVTVTKS